MIELYPEVVVEADNEGYHPLRFACKTSYEAVIMKLLDIYSLAALASQEKKITFLCIWHVTFTQTYP
jgi:hypothetical protein